MRLTTLYRYFDAEGRLLYVGITTAGIRRARGHVDHSAWWLRAASATFEHFSNLEAALAAEDAAIKAEKPLFNIRGTGTAIVRSRTRTRANGAGSVYRLSAPGHKRPWVAAVVIGWKDGRPIRRSKFATTELGAQIELARLMEKHGLTRAEPSA